MKKPIKQRVYVREIHHYDWLVKSHNDDLIDHVKQSEGYFFTPEQLNEYTANVIKQALETAADEAQTIDTYKTRFSGLNKLSFIEKDVYKPSIINTFEETYKKFEV